MTIEQLNELKYKYQMEVHYFSGIGFPILQGKFQEVVNILTDFEETIKENMELRARIQALEALTQTKETITDVARESDCEVFNI